MKNRIEDTLPPAELEQSIELEWSDFTSLHDHQATRLAKQWDVDAIVREVEAHLPWTARQPRRGKSICILNLRSTRYHLTTPLPIFLEDDPNGSVAIAYDLGQYGSGPSEEDAIADLCETIVEYYELLTSEASNLGTQLQTHLNFLQTIISEHARDATQKKNKP